MATSPHIKTPALPLLRKLAALILNPFARSLKLFRSLAREEIVNGNLALFGTTKLGREQLL